MNDQEKISIVTGSGMWHIGQDPQIAVSDGPNGLRKQSEEATTNNDSILATCYPTAVTLADSWDPEMISRVADALAGECIREEVSILLGPGVNIKRAPTGGRNFEYYSEDPYLAGKFAAAYIRAVETRGVGTSLKHFAGNSQERYRMTSNSEIDDRALHEIYLRAFEIAVKEGRPATVMASYNRLNGTYSCENAYLLTDLLRDRWHYQGVVLSDWGACTDLPASIRAGMDLEMPDSVGFHRPDLEEVLRNDRDGSMHRSLDRAAENVDRLIHKYAAWDTGNAGCVSDADTDPHHVACEAAVNGAVLLQNNGALPLADNTKVYAAGPLLDPMRIQGGGSSHIHIRRNPDMRAALGRKYRIVEQPEDAEVILYFGGLTDETEGEGFDRDGLELPAGETADIRRMLDYGKDFVLIAFSGSPFVIPYRDEIKAVLYMGLPGEAADEAVMQLISGAVSPSGKLAETWPLSFRDVPCHDCYSGDTRDIEYRESVFVGYRYYDTFGIPVQFPFGYGLSFTEFAYSDLSCDGKTARITIRNTGTRDGAEVVQIYVENPPGGFLRERRALHGFCKVFLRAGEARRIEIPLDDRAFQVWSPETNGYITVGGTYTIAAGAGLDDIRQRVSVQVDGLPYDRNDRDIYPECFDRNGERNGERNSGTASGRDVYFAADGFRKLYERDGHRLSDLSGRSRGQFDRTASIREMCRSSPLCRIFHKIAEREIPKMFPGKDRSDPEVRMTEEGLLDGTIDAAAIQSGGMISKAMEEALIDDANGHHLRAIGKLIAGRKS